MNRLPTEDSFLKTVADHRMVIMHDDGVYRHIRFKRPDSGMTYFDITTWPGYLCYSGDMGCYVFNRIHDMFEFFRYGRDDGKLHINPGYWGEKVQAPDRCDGMDRYEPELFKAAIYRYLDEYEASVDVRKAVDRYVLPYADEGQHEAVGAALGFEHDGFRFQDFWEYTVREVSYRFLWCCYALAWAVKTYDANADNAITPEKQGVS